MAHATPATASDRLLSTSCELSFYDRMTLDYPTEHHVSPAASDGPGVDIRQDQDREADGHHHRTPKEIAGAESDSGGSSIGTLANEVEQPTIGAAGNYAAFAAPGTQAPRRRVLVIDASALNPGQPIHIQVRGNDVSGLQFGNNNNIHIGDRYQTPSGNGEVIVLENGQARGCEQRWYRNTQGELQTWVLVVLVLLAVVIAHSFLYPSPAGNGGNEP